MKDCINLPVPHHWTKGEIRQEYERIGDRRMIAKIYDLPLREVNRILKEKAK